MGDFRTRYRLPASETVTQYTPVFETALTGNAWIYQTTAGVSATVTGGGRGSEEEMLGPTSVKMARMFAIGLGSGFLAGVFGVGGGVVTVPALSLATDLSHKEVRFACCCCCRWYCCCCCCCSRTLSCTIKSVVTAQAPVTGVEEYSKKKKKTLWKRHMWIPWLKPVEHPPKICIKCIYWKSTYVRNMPILERTFEHSNL